MSTFNYVDWLTQEGLRMLLNELECAQFANTDYNKEFTKPFAIGDTVRVPKPQRWNVTTGMGYQPQAMDRPYTTVTVDQNFGIHFTMDDIDAALKMERGREAIKKAYLDTAMAQIAQEIDSRFASFATLHSNNIVGVLGTDPTSFSTINQARARMKQLAAPSGSDKGLIIPPSFNVALTNAAVQYFNPAKQISEQFREGYIGFNNGFKAYESMSLVENTAGTWAGAVTVKTQPTEGSNTLVVTCTTGDTFLAGNVIGIADVYAVNPSTRNVTTRVTTKQYVVMADATGASSEATLTLSPPFISTGHYQNINAIPLVGAALTLYPGTTDPNGKVGTSGLAIQRDAFAMVGVPLEKPTAVEMSSVTRDPKTGIAVNFVRQFDGQLRRMINRFDVLLGFGELYPDNCCVRVLGAS
jgi:hypothetical protein